MLISICIPCYNSSKTLNGVIDEVRSEFAKHPEHEYQIVLVNDGSKDNTFEVIRQLCSEDDRITGVNFSKNQGQSSAKMAAVNYAIGDCLVYMDDDGQHPAYGIFTLVGKLEEGYDVVYAKFSKKKHNAFKRITSNSKKKLAEMMGTKPKGVDTSPFCAWSRICIDAIKQYDSPFPSPNAYLRCVTDKFTDVEMEHRQRAAGHSGYTFKKMMGLWLTGFTNFSIVPLRMASYLGTIIAFIGFIAGIIVAIRKIVHPTMAAGYASTICIMLFISGIIMIMLGLIGEYIGRIYMILSRKPQYYVAEVIEAEYFSDHE